MVEFAYSPKAYPRNAHLSNIIKDLGLEKRAKIGYRAIVLPEDAIKSRAYLLVQNSHQSEL